MAFRELTMIDVKEVLRRWSAGQGDRKIGREAGVDRKTVARYTATATRLGLQRGSELSDEEVHQVAQCVQARPLVAPTEEWNEVAHHRDRIERWLAGDEQTRPLRLTKVHTLLCRDHGLQASYDNALALRAPAALVARQALDGARRRSASRPGGAGGLRQDGVAARR